MTYSLLFSTSKAPLKNSSLEARNGLKTKFVFVLKLDFDFLSYINFASSTKFLSISEITCKSAILMSVLISFSIPDSEVAAKIISSIISKFG